MAVQQECTQLEQETWRDITLRQGATKWMFQNKELNPCSGDRKLGSLKKLQIQILDLVVEVVQ